MDDLERELKLEEIKTLPYSEWDPLMHVYDFDTNVLPNWLQWLTSYAVGAERQKIFSYVINEKLLNKEFARDPKDPILNQIPVVDDSGNASGDSRSGSDNNDHNDSASLMANIADSFTNKNGQIDKFIKFHSEKGLSKPQFDAFLWELLAYYLEHNNHQTIKESQFTNSLDVIDADTPTNPYYSGGGGGGSPSFDNGIGNNGNGTGNGNDNDNNNRPMLDPSKASTHAKDASLFLLPSEMELNFDNDDDENNASAVSLLSPSPLPETPINASSNGSSSNSSNNGKDEKKVNGGNNDKGGGGGIEYENALSKAKERVSMNPKLYEKIVSKIRDTTMKEKAKRNHERHSSLNKFSDNSKYQILSDIYKLILKSEQFVNGMRNNVNRLYDEKYYIPYPISSTEDGIEDEFAQIKSLPMRFSWKFIWNIDNIICGYSLSGVDDDEEPMDEPYDNSNDYGSNSQYGGSGTGDPDDDEQDTRVWPYLLPEKSILPKEILFQMAKQQTKNDNSNKNNNNNNKQQQNDKPSASPDNLDNSRDTNETNDNDHDDSKDESNSDGEHDDDDDNENDDDDGDHVRGDTMQLATVDLDTNEVNTTSMGRPDSHRSAALLDENLDPITREAFTKINSIYQNVTATNQNIVSFSSTFERFRVEYVIHKRKKITNIKKTTKDIYEKWRVVILTC